MSLPRSSILNCSHFLPFLCRSHCWFQVSNIEPNALPMAFMQQRSRAFDADVAEAGETFSGASFDRGVVAPPCSLQVLRGTKKRGQQKDGPRMEKGLSSFRLLPDTCAGSVRELGSHRNSQLRAYRPETSLVEELFLLVLVHFGQVCSTCVPRLRNPSKVTTQEVGQVPRF